MNQVTVIKTAAARTSTRAATQAAPVATPVLAFALGMNFRPAAGQALFAHTEAFMTLSGMYDGATIPRAQLAGIIGPRAVQYHAEQGNLECSGAGVCLSDRGQTVFANRTTNPEMVEALTELLSAGTTAKDLSFLPKDYAKGLKTL